MSIIFVALIVGAIIVALVVIQPWGSGSNDVVSATPAATSYPQPELTTGEVCELVRQKIVDSLASVEEPSVPRSGSLATIRARRGNTELKRRQRFISQLASPDCKPTFRAGTWTLTMNDATFSIRESTRVVVATNSTAQDYLK